VTTLELEDAATGETSQARLVPGRDAWWFLGTGGVVRMAKRHVTESGDLQPETKRRLQELGLYAKSSPRYYALTVLTSTDCNLGCGYCFQNTGQDPTEGTRPPRIAHARLTRQTIDGIMGFARRQMAASALEQMKILLFGGEPLLNPRGCLELLAAAGDHGMTEASVTSNLTLLTPELASQLWDRGLRSAQVTFDGDRADHDVIRVRRSGGGSFDAIVRNLVRASQATPLLWRLRVNVSDRNYAGVDALLDRVAAALGAAELDLERCTFSFARVGDVGVGYGNGLKYDGDMAQTFARWHRRALDLGFSINRPGAIRPCHVCGHGGRYGATVSADGTLASCWDNAGKPGWEVGTVTDGYLPPGITRERWTSCGAEYQHAVDGGARTAFNNAVDGAILDDLRDRGRL
jgi:uncharacterized protein